MITFFVDFLEILKFSSYFKRTSTRLSLIKSKHVETGTIRKLPLEKLPMVNPLSNMLITTFNES